MKKKESQVLQRKQREEERQAWSKMPKPSRDYDNYLFKREQRKNKKKVYYTIRRQIQLEFPRFFLKQYIWLQNGMTSYDQSHMSHQMAKRVDCFFFNSIF